MGHNLSHRKVLDLERSARIALLQPLLVPGWRIDNDARRFTEIDTVLGAYQRDQTVLLRCAAADCRRRVELGLHMAVQFGLGDCCIADVARRLRCPHWAGCQLKLASMTYKQGVPLIAYVEQSDVLIAVACVACAARSLLPARAVIERLLASGRGSGATGVLELGRRVRGPCRACGGRQFEAALIWPGQNDAAADGAADTAGSRGGRATPRS